MKRGTPRHPKLQHLSEKLKKDRPTCIGYLELLWHFTAEFAPQGNIGKFSDARIEAAVDWDGPCGKFVKSLTTCGWCDTSSEFRIVIHDWHEHCEESVKKRLTRLRLPFLSESKSYAESDRTLSRHVETLSPSMADNGSLARARLPSPKPLPKPKPSPDAAPPAADAAAKPQGVPVGDLFAFFEDACRSAGLVVEPTLWREFPSAVQTADEAEAMRANLAGWLEHPRYSGGMVTARKLAVERQWLRPAIVPNGRPRKKNVWTELLEEAEAEQAEKGKTGHAN